MIDPRRIAAIVRKRMVGRDPSVYVFWCAVTGPREECAQALRNELADLPVAVLVAREARFDNPNAMLGDVISVVERNKQECLEFLAKWEGEGRAFGVLLLGRRELGVAQSASPVTMPDWFPVWGGRLLSVAIEDVTWVAEAPLSAPEVRIGEVSERLFTLEEVMLRRIEAVQRLDPRRTNAFLDVFRRNSGEKINELLASAWEARKEVTNAKGFRPSVRDGRSLIARIWGVVQRVGSDGLAGPGGALVAALDLPSAPQQPWYESIVAVLLRGTGREADDPRRFARNVLVCVAASCQLVTAAAHSDGYASYPILLLRGVSLDLRRGLERAEALVRSLPRPR